MALALTAEARADAIFPAAALLPTEGSPRAAGFGDVTWDGDPDLVVVGSEGTLVVHPGDRGQFSVPRTFTVGGKPSDVAVFDVDGDGHDDVVWTDATTGFLNWAITSGTTTVFVSLQSVSGADEAVAMRVYDREGDGWLDVVVVHQGADALTFYRNQGGVFVRESSLPTGDGPAAMALLQWPGQPRSYAVAQAGALSNDLVVYAGDPPQPRQRLDVAGANWVESGSWNADPYPDLVVLAGEAGELRVYLGASDGTLVLDQTVRVSGGSRSFLWLRNVGDHRRVLVSETRRNRVRMVEGPVDGVLLPTGAWFLGEGVGEPLALDVDADGILEVAVPLDAEEGVALMQRSGAGYLAYPSTETGSLPKAIAASGDRVAVLCFGSSEVMVYRLVDDALRFIESLPIGFGSEALVWGNLDDNESSDLAVLRLGQTIDLWREVGGELQALASLPVAGRVTDIAMGDVDGDGQGDLVLGDQQGNAIRVLRGDGLGGFVDYEVIPFAGALPSVHLHDLDGDGRDDLLLLDAVRSLFLRYSDPGGFSAPQRFSVGDQPQRLALANLNRDGIPDIVVGNLGDGTFSTLESVLPRTYAAGLLGEIVADGIANLTATDLTGDGLDDVAVATAVGRNVSVHVNLDDGEFGVPVQFRASTLALDLAAADVNADGQQDLLVLDSVGNAVVSLVNGAEITVPAPAFWLRAWRSAGTVELEAAGPGLLEIVRKRDGHIVPMQQQESGRWRGRDASAGLWEEIYGLRGSGGLLVAETTVGAANLRLELSAPRPNPSFEQVSFRFRVPAGTRPQVRVFDVRGRLVRDLAWQEDGAGEFSAVWLGRDASGNAVADGRYVVEVRAGSQRAVRPFTRRTP